MVKSKLRNRVRFLTIFSFVHRYVVFGTFLWLVFVHRDVGICMRAFFLFFLTEKRHFLKGRGRGAGRGRGRGRRRGEEKRRRGEEKKAEDEKNWNNGDHGERRDKRRGGEAARSLYIANSRSPASGGFTSNMRAGQHLP